MEEGLEKSKRGAVEIYGKDKLKLAYKLSLLGCTNAEMSDALEISMSTFNLWMTKHPEFSHEILRGKKIANAKMAASLHKRGLGFYYEEERAFNNKGEIIVATIKKYCPPDSWAAARWLQLREREIWGEISRVEVKNTQVNLTQINLAKLTNEELMLFQKLGLQALTDNVGGN